MQINSRQHTEALFIYQTIFLVATGCFKGLNPDVETQIKDCILEIKKAELNKEKADKNNVRAYRLAKKLFSIAINENGAKILLAVKYLFEHLINQGFEIFTEQDEGYKILNGLLEMINPEEIIDFNKKDRKAKELAIKWSGTLKSEGYFI